ncbi:MAG: prolipoprotein diacylglyceryl transferase [Alistipes sp.]|nr:prolipoprotein diacylglyceryl transferase [Alistipes sp.]
MGFLSIVWDFNPTLFSIGSVEIRYYSVTWMLTFLIGMWMFEKFVRQDGYPDKVFNSVFWFGFLSTIIGARLGHCLFYEPEYYLSDPIKIFYIRQGGLASHGAAVGLLLGLWMFSRKNKIPYIWSLDRIMLPVTVGGGLVRLGNLMNSEIYGSPTSLPWGFEFIRDPRWWQPVAEGGSGALPVHPTQIYEAICYFITFGILVWLFYKRDAGHKRPGLVFGVGLIGVFLSRFFIEFIKNPQEAFEADMSLLMGQWLSIPFIVAGIWLTVRALRRPEAVDFPQPVNGRPARKIKDDGKSNIKPLNK